MNLKRKRSRFEQLCKQNTKYKNSQVRWYTFHFQNKAAIHHLSKKPSHTATTDHPDSSELPPTSDRPNFDSQLRNQVEGDSKTVEKAANSGRAKADRGSSGFSLIKSTGERAMIGPRWERERGSGGPSVRLLYSPSARTLYLPSYEYPYVTRWRVWICILFAVADRGFVGNVPPRHGHLF